MTRFTRSRSVTGAAHTTWSMFGARGPLLAPDEDKAGGSAPPPAPAGDPPAPVPAPAPAPAASVSFTPEQQEYINKLVGNARQEGRKAATPPAPAPAPPAPAPEPKLTVEALAQRLAETELRARFDKRAAKRGYDDDAADDLFELYKAQKPTDDEQWFGEREKRLGLKRPTSPDPATSTTVTVPPVAAGGAPISDRGSPAPSGVVGWRLEFAQNPIGMSAASRQQMNAELGEDKARKQRLEASKAQAERMHVNWKG